MALKMYLCILCKSLKLSTISIDKSLILSIIIKLNIINCKWLIIKEDMVDIKMKKTIGGLKN